MVKAREQTSPSVPPSERLHPASSSQLVGSPTAASYNGCSLTRHVSDRQRKFIRSNINPSEAEKSFSVVILMLSVKTIASVTIQKDFACLPPMNDVVRGRFKMGVRLLLIPIYRILKISAGASGLDT